TLCLAKLNPGFVSSTDITDIWLFVSSDSTQLENTAYFDNEDLGRSKFKSVSWHDISGDHSALVYLYDNAEQGTEHYAFVKYEGYAYHFANQESSQTDTLVEVVDDNQGKVFLPSLSSCVIGEYEWSYNPDAT
ncbi:hypothetical protein V1515DRAFT_539325, partial [Lipomyces mesembrius]